MTAEHIVFVILSFFATYGIRSMYLDAKLKGYI